ncbi:ABC transporter ATP-binding protein [Pseudothermotoga thermarum]|uniref:Oligopeptide/dipeptide ABC transporter, ATPase subunit n=1 Tax=Pseudothermotoga thermarum DSM 5069 TaxID=688269 RepID=F7YYK7_9THEM|nr:oligopeptide/dipeptide ABC transporter ATP-binding protein [Pseudothermotoga thermarum]AEH51039.1 oligopeptide/dipeptide ABC transporter, ATPase subunit [Pseudothermotoga thermarum DSM 5069]
MEPLIRVENLKKYFEIRKSIFSKPLYVRAVDDVSFDIPKGSIFAVVGESGSGKSTLGRLILRLIEPTSGNLYFKGVNILKLDGKEMLEYRRKMQIVQQDPYNSLHPRKLVKDIIGEGLKIHFKMKRNEIYSKVKGILELVGLREEHMFRYPHEFSGGQRQRIAIARVLVLKPEFIVLDEPTSALDVSVQARVLAMLKELKENFSLTYMFITHNLAVVDYMATHVAVMYLGKIMEIGSKDDIFNHPSHPYTKILLDCVPSVGTGRRIRTVPKGEIPSPINPPSGCVFHTRCPKAEKICQIEEPNLLEVSPGHFCRCHFYG